MAVGETHAIRVDVRGAGGRRVSAVQAHESFRRIVGQSAAEFTLAMLGGGLDGEQTDSTSGVYTPEVLFSKKSVRERVLKRLLNVPGTLNYGFEEVGESSDNNNSKDIETVRGSGG
eukprot:CAMPEP_0197530904 /NCGR_PEP_ID=MMETSP1318-20131121/33364_1 /TAXON_ID=552666 /ORGANISM="Partenskyella glossopodia, Strain RCC365" /LENGTH=115 /DNA_ID=CAMNT_0043086913 /DNA_START=57 /DNA_END=400 /DNA_ORIENTATION=-